MIIEVKELNNYKDIIGEDISIVCEELSKKGILCRFYNNNFSDDSVKGFDFSNKLFEKNFIFKEFYILKFKYHYLKT
ncbi:MAG: hypothetical protein ABI721_03085 [Candidatus Dojkabacteria bacterium]